MKKSVLLRHGESGGDGEIHCTAWADADLAGKGLADSRKSGELVRACGRRKAKI
jgi:bisphosphoglycerate-dependent phosphoglycerate mutase